MGNVLSKAQLAAGEAVQPHWCGERCVTSGDSVASGGSAPLVWGTCFIGGGFVGGGWFSPTGVGNVTDHWIFYIFFYGSAPLVWGTLVQPLREGE